MEKRTRQRRQDQRVVDLAFAQAQNRFGGWTTRIAYGQSVDGLPHPSSVESYSGWKQYV